LGTKDKWLWDNWPLIYDQSLITDNLKKKWKVNIKYW
jgi:hypothetical protein